MSDERGGPELLRSKRAATRYWVLVDIARRQPAVNQREIADTIGVTVQAVSEHRGDPADSGYVNRQARGRYEEGYRLAHRWTPSKHPSGTSLRT